MGTRISIEISRQAEVISSQRVIGINFIRKGNFDSDCICFNGPHLIVSILYL